MSVESFPQSNKNISPEQTDDYPFDLVESQQFDGEMNQEHSRSLGRRALGATVNFVPSKMKDMYQSEYGQKLVGIAKGAVAETGMAAAIGGAKAIGERFGVNYENGSLDVRKLKLAREVFKLVKAPYLEGALIAKDAGKEAIKSGKQEARSQAYSARSTVTYDAIDYLQTRRAA